MVYSHKQASMYINTHPQCSPASVGLAQAHPKYINQQLPHQLGSLKQCHLQSFWHSEISGPFVYIVLI